MNQLPRQAAGYVGASALALAVDFALLSLQVSVLGMPYLVAAAVSFMAGTLIVYWASIRHVFDYRRLADWRYEFLVFAGLGAAALLVNLVAMYSFVEGFGVHYLIAKIGAAGFTFCANFILRRWILFSRRSASNARGTVNVRVGS